MLQGLQLECGGIQKAKEEGAGLRGGCWPKRYKKELSTEKKKARLYAYTSIHKEHVMTEVIGKQKEGKQRKRN